MTRVAVLLRGMAILALTLTAAGSRAESLYDPGLYRSLGTDRKAARIGDVLTIQVVETSSASSAADTSTEMCIRDRSNCEYTFAIACRVVLLDGESPVPARPATMPYPTSEFSRHPLSLPRSLIRTASAAAAARGAAVPSTVTINPAIARTTINARIRNPAN